MRVKQLYATTTRNPRPLDASKVFYLRHLPLAFLPKKLVEVSRAVFWSRSVQNFVYRPGFFAANGKLQLYKF